MVQQFIVNVVRHGATLMCALGAFVAQAQTPLAQNVFSAPLTIAGWWGLSAVNSTDFGALYPYIVTRWNPDVNRTQTAGVSANGSVTIVAESATAPTALPTEWLTEDSAGWTLTRTDRGQTLTTHIARTAERDRAEIVRDQLTDEGPWILFSGHAGTAPHYELVNYFAALTGEAKRLAFDRPVLAVEARASQIGIVAMYPNAVGKAVPHFELYSNNGAALTLVTRRAIDRWVDANVSTPVGQVCFLAQQSRSGEWLIGRTFLKWNDVLRIGADGGEVGRVPYARSSPCDSPFHALPNAQERREVFNGRLIEVLRSQLLVRGVDITSVYVDGSLAATFSGQYSHPGGMLIQNDALYLALPNLDNASTLRTDLFTARLADLIARVPQNTGATEIAAPNFLLEAQLGAVPMIEYYNVDLDHFFYTLFPEEQRFIETGGAGAGWHRIGFAFYAWAPGMQGADTVPVCRFYGTRGIGPNSHFFTASQAECEAVQKDRGWTLETKTAFYVWKDISAQPVNRWYNNRFATNDSNHRFSAHGTGGHHSIYGWINEGTVFPP